MNHASDKNPAPKRSKGLWWSLVILFVILPTATLISVKTLTSGSMTKRTQTIITTIITGLELSVGSKGVISPPEFTRMLEDFDNDTLADLRAMQAIDDSRHCFVDAWDRPLTIRLGTNQRFEVISSGPDGLPGTSDDLR